MQGTFEEDFGAAEAKLKEYQAEFDQSPNAPSTYLQGKLELLKNDLDVMQSQYTKRWQIRAVNDLRAELDKLLRQVNRILDDGLVAKNTPGDRGPPSIMPFGAIQRQAPRQAARTATTTPRQLTSYQGSTSPISYEVAYVRKPGRPRLRLMPLPNEEPGLLSTELYWVRCKRDTFQPVLVPSWE
jgi:hypothetical protein